MAKKKQKKKDSSKKKDSKKSKGTSEKKEKKKEKEKKIDPQKAYEKGCKEFMKGNYEKARKNFEEGADGEHALSQLALAPMFIYGLGGKVNLEKGEKLREKGLDHEKVDDVVFELARNGDAVAQYIMGDLYEFGRLVKSDYGEAVNWYQKAEIEGHPLAKFRLAHLYYYGLGVKQKNYELVVQYQQQAADKDVGAAQYQLGRIHEEGFGVPQNYDEAVKWYEKSFEKNVVDASKALKVLAERDIPGAKEVLDKFSK